MPKTINRNLAVRTLSAVVLLVVVLGALLFSKYGLLGLLLIICFSCLREFYHIARVRGTSPQSIYGIAAGLLMVSITFLVACGLISIFYALLFIVVPALVIFFLPFVIELYRKTENPLENIAVTLTGIIYVGLPLSLLTFIALPDTEYRPWTLLSYLFIIWANDIGAYLTGITLGRHKLFERVSPKKTWEGFFGGVVLAIGTGILCGYLLNESLGLWAGLAVVAALSGVLGDLVESLFKRSAEIKDSGSVMPGHGGMLDRFDALVFSAPFVFIYFLIFTF